MQDQSHQQGGGGGHNNNRRSTRRRTRTTATRSSPSPINNNNRNDYYTNNNNTTFFFADHHQQYDDNEEDAARYYNSNMRSSSNDDDVLQQQYQQHRESHQRHQQNRHRQQQQQESSSNKKQAPVETRRTRKRAVDEIGKSAIAASDVEDGQLLEEGEEDPTKTTNTNKKKYAGHRGHAMSTTSTKRKEEEEVGRDHRHRRHHHQSPENVLQQQQQPSPPPLAAAASSSATPVQSKKQKKEEVGGDDDSTLMLLWDFLREHHNSNSLGFIHSRLYRGITKNSTRSIGTAKLVVIVSKATQTYLATTRRREEKNALVPGPQQIPFNQNIIEICKKHRVPFLLLDDTESTYKRLESLLGKDKAKNKKTMLSPVILVRKINVLRMDQFRIIVPQLQQRQRQRKMIASTAAATAQNSNTSATNNTDEIRAASAASGVVVGGQRRTGTPTAEHAEQDARVVQRGADFAQRQQQSTRTSSEDWESRLWPILHAHIQPISSCNKYGAISYGFTENNDSFFLIHLAEEDSSKGKEQVTGMIKESTNSLVVIFQRSEDAYVQLNQDIVNNPVMLAKNQVRWNKEILECCQLSQVPCIVLDVSEDERERQLDALLGRSNDVKSKALITHAVLIQVKHRWEKQIKQMLLNPPAAEPARQENTTMQNDQPLRPSGPPPLIRPPQSPPAEPVSEKPSSMPNEPSLMPSGGPPPRLPAPEPASQENRSLEPFVGPPPELPTAEPVSEKPSTMPNGPSIEPTGGPAPYLPAPEPASKEPSTMPNEPPPEPSCGSPALLVTEHSDLNLSENTSYVVVALEEEIALLEDSVQHLTERQHSVNQQLKDSEQQRERALESSRGLETRAASLKLHLQKQMALREELQSSLSKSQRILARLMKASEINDMTVEEITELAQMHQQHPLDGTVTTDGDNVDGAVPSPMTDYDDNAPPNDHPATNLLSDSEDEEGSFRLYEVGDRPAPMGVCCPATEKMLCPKRLCLFWRTKEDLIDKRIATFLPCVHAEKGVLLSIMNISAREVLAADTNDPRARHRREAFWNTILDFRLVSTVSVSPPNGTDGKHTDSSQDVLVKSNQPTVDGSGPVGESGFDPNISLCPYELSGSCADPYCSYQHLEKRLLGSVLPRELLPLPPLKLAKEKTNKQPQSNKKNSEKKQARPLPERSANNIPRGTIKLKETDESIFANNDDFISLPTFDGGHSAEEEQSSKPEDDASCHTEDVQSRECLGHDVENEKNIILPFWWMESSKDFLVNTDGMYASTQISFSRVLVILGFPLVEDNSTGSLPGVAFPADVFGACLFLGKIVDWTRLSIHAGRFTVAETLNGTYMERLREWRKEDKSFLVPFRSVSEEILKALSQACNSAFAYNASDENPFLCAYDAQVMVCLCSCLVKQMNSDLLHKKAETPIKEWLRDSKRIVSLFHPDEDEWAVADKHANQQKCPQTFPAIRTSLLDPPSNTFNSTTPSIFQWNFEVFSQEVGLIRRASHAITGYSELSVRSLIDNVLEPCLAKVKQIIGDLKNAPEDETPTVLTGVAIQTGYIILGVLSSAANRIGVAALNGRHKNEMAELFAVADRILMYLHHTGVPEIDLLLAPVFAVTISLANTLQMYDRVQQRLESLLLLGSTAANSGLNFMCLSEIIWSQLVQLRFSLPLCNQISQEEDIKEPTLPHFELPETVYEENAAIASQVRKLGICLHHIQLDGDWNLSRGLSQQFQQDKLSLGGKMSDLHDSCSILLRTLYGECQQPILEFSRENHPLLNLRSTYGSPSPLRSAMPRSLLLGGAHMTTLKLNSCSLARLPCHFGSYFPSLLVLELNGNHLEELPLSFTLMSTLGVLCVDANKLVCIPSSFHFPHLTKFMARGNRLTVLPEFLKNCKDLEILELRDNPLHSEDLGSLATLLPKLRVLLWK